MSKKIKKENTKIYNVVLLGAGTVNGELANLFAEANAQHKTNGGPRFEIRQVLVKNGKKKRANIDPKTIVTDPEKVKFEGADIVIEALGGLEPSRALAIRALNAGIPYVTANKTLVAYHGRELAKAAKKSGASLHFEAAVGGVTPCIRIIRETLKGVKVRRIYGVLNGTSHFVLSQIKNPDISLKEAVTLAQAHGYAEADPSADLDGHDAAQKLAILGWCIGDDLLSPERIPRVELPTLNPDTACAAAHIGFAVKPLASLSWTKGGKTDAWIAPAAVPVNSPLAATTGTEASVVIETRRAGTIFLSAQGAGGGPTASALFDDVIDVLEGPLSSKIAKGPRIDPGGADDPREWIVHAPILSDFDGIALGKHIAANEGDIQRFENLNTNGWIAHVSGINYHPEFTEPLVKGGACVLEIVR